MLMDKVVECCCCPHGEQDMLVMFIISIQKSKMSHVDNVTAVGLADYECDTLLDGQMNVQG